MIWTVLGHSHKFTKKLNQNVTMALSWFAMANKYFSTKFVKTRKKLAISHQVLFVLCYAMKSPLFALKLEWVAPGASANVDKWVFER